MSLISLRFVAASALLLAGCASRTTMAGSSSSSTAAPAAAPAMDHDHMAGMAGMSGMSGMDAPVTIPKGANFTVADVHFMQGMIAHHSQAIFMSKLAATNGANPRLLKFATKIDQSQMAEIRLMQEWLVANGQTAPDTSSYHHMMMTGMLTAAEMAELKAARGPTFDRRFLQLMIKHHEGALSMVQDLFATPRAGQDVDVSVFANDVVSVQTAEIDAMRQMLAEWFDAN